MIQRYIPDSCCHGVRRFFNVLDRYENVPSNKCLLLQMQKLAFFFKLLSSFESTPELVPSSVPESARQLHFKFSFLEHPKLEAELNVLNMAPCWTLSLLIYIFSTCTLARGPMGSQWMEKAMKKHKEKLAKMPEELNKMKDHPLADMLDNDAVNTKKMPDLNPLNLINDDDYRHNPFDNALFSIHSIIMSDSIC